MAIRHLELFSGIGGFRKALDLISKDFSIEVKNIGYSEIDKCATQTYKANFNTDKETEIGDIVSFTSDKANIKLLRPFNLLTGGFPCQSFSMMGKQRGFKDSRGNVFFRIIDIVEEKKPSFILLENVKNLINHDNGHTFNVIKQSLEDQGYTVFCDVFNTSNFGLPQTRNRVYIFATRKKLPKSFVFSQNAVVESYKNIKKKTSLVSAKYTYELLDSEVDKKYYLSEKIKPTILADGTKTYRSRSTIDRLIAAPLTATMMKMHRACQDNYFSDDYLQSDDKTEYIKKVFTKEELAKKRIRRITPKEAFRLQGFDDVFFENALSENISDAQLYKQAGNAVSVNTVYAILYYLIVDKKIIK